MNDDKPRMMIQVHDAPCPFCGRVTNRWSSVFNNFVCAECEEAERPKRPAWWPQTDRMLALYVRMFAILLFLIFVFAVSCQQMRVSESVSDSPIELVCDGHDKPVGGMS